MASPYIYFMRDLSPERWQQLHSSRRLQYQVSSNTIVPLSGLKHSPMVKTSGGRIINHPRQLGSSGGSVRIMSTRKKLRDTRRVGEDDRLSGDVINTPTRFSFLQVSFCDITRIQTLSSLY